MRVPRLHADMRPAPHLRIQLQPCLARAAPAAAVAPVTQDEGAAVQHAGQQPEEGQPAQRGRAPRTGGASEGLEDMGQHSHCSQAWPLHVPVLPTGWLTPLLPRYSYRKDMLPAGHSTNLVSSCGIPPDITAGIPSGIPTARANRQPNCPSGMRGRSQATRPHFPGRRSRWAARGGACCPSVAAT